MNWRETIAAPVIVSTLASVILNRRIASIIAANVSIWLGVALVAVVAPLGVVAGRRIHALRQQVQAQERELEQARLVTRELVTRDELTGLLTPHHMERLLRQELQRRFRSGQSFCLIRLAIDAPGDLSDAVLQGLARETMLQVRAPDGVARWGEREFVVMMLDTRAAMAQGITERLIGRLHAVLAEFGPQAAGVTVAGGLAEHRAGEPAELTLERAAAALAAARAAGTSRLHVA